MDAREAKISLTFPMLKFLLFAFKKTSFFALLFLKAFSLCPPFVRQIVFNG